MHTRVKTVGKAAKQLFAEAALLRKSNSLLFSMNLKKKEKAGNLVSKARVLAARKANEIKA